MYDKKYDGDQKTNEGRYTLRQSAEGKERGKGVRRGRGGGIATLIAEALAKIKPTDPFRSGKQGPQTNRN